ncbi:MAG: DNA-directed RNA polymerase subunit K [Candidatus Diapherotrites archaeon]
MEALTRFEKARIISARALQLSLGAPPLVEVPKASSPIDVAGAEFNEKMIPLVVLRRYPNGEVKKVSLSEGD